MPTIKEIAEATGRGKSTVMRAVKELGLRESGHANPDGARGALIIDAEGASMLADFLTKNVEAKQAAGEGETESSNQPHIDVEAIVSVYRERIDDLKAQIDNLNAQLAIKDNQIKELTCALDNAQDAAKEAQTETRRAHDQVVLMASAGVWERLTGFKGLLGPGSDIDSQ
ncbi:hypothetical protein [Collinsella ihumii]|uniref:Uncharacterized protein n=1 Tax=Collinsella ihumii TaxID=1720204 RepID=A0AAW7K244_9ACTN|nr:hypothetical protein [Collinsella ihumii]MDN0068901.1 hypothetical protein [Collinsella ihumii]